jgi:hypothetical protein
MTCHEETHKDENNVKIQNLLDIIKIDVKDRGNVDAGLLLYKV